MFDEKEMEFLQKNFKAAIANSISAGSEYNTSMWTNILLKLQAMPGEGEVASTNTNNSTSDYKFKDFNRDNIKMLRDVVKDSISITQNNIAFKVGDISYTSNSADVKLQLFTMDNNNGKPISKDEILKLEYMKYLPKYASRGFKEQHFLKEFEMNGRIYQFSGFIPRGKKYVYTARRFNEHDKVYSFTREIEHLVL